MNDILFVGEQSAVQEIPTVNAQPWALIYCLSGTGLFVRDGEELPFQSGQAVVFPPEIPYTAANETNYRGILILMASATLPFKRPAVIRDDRRGSIRMAFESLLYHFQSDGTENSNLIAAYGSLIVCYLASYQTERSCPQVVTAIEQDIIRHIADPSYALDSFMKTLPFSYDYLRKLFQREKGVTPHQLLINVRLKVAADALLNTEASSPSMSDICRLCGFREPLYFSRMFKKRYGVSPSFYAKAKQEGEGRN